MKNILRKIADYGKKITMSRKYFLQTLSRTTLVAFLGSLIPVFLHKAKAKDYVWQINPHKCMQCERCVTNCVLSRSAVKVVHEYEICGYCKLCFGYFQPGADKLDESAHNQLCPTGAIKRTFIEDPYFEYTIDEDLCIGCAKCVSGCGAFGNGSLFLQVRHDRCLNCNNCEIARTCPSGAFQRVPREQLYILKGTSYEI